jgi:hypothetical protein
VDFWNRHRNTLTLRPLSLRVPELQAAFKNGLGRLKTVTKPKPLKIDSAKIEKLRTITFVVVSVIFGIWAYQTCCEETSLEWQKRHFPSASIWKTGLQAEGYTLLQNQKTLSQALKNLPSRLDTGNKAWQSVGSKGQPAWWAIYGISGDSFESSPGNSGDPLIFCVRCSETPHSWEPVGEGWSGFETVVAKAREQVRLYPAEKRVVLQRKEFFDPREIRY